MKPAIAILVCSGLLVAAAAVAQEPVLVCVRAADGSCVWVNQDELPQADPVPAPPTPPHDEAALNRAGMESEVWFDWASASLEPDPLIGQPGVCAKTAARARYRFAIGMQAGDINKIIESYDWRGKSTDDANRLVDRLDALPKSGAWERSVVTGWTGEDAEVSALAGEHWRWSGNGQVSYFDMRKVDDCWFVVFGSDPGTTAIVRRQRQAEPVETQPGVYEF